MSLTDRRAARFRISGAALAIAIACDAAMPMAHAKDGDLDRTFGKAGKVLTDFDRSADIANAVTLQADGKIVVVGTTYTNDDSTTEDFAIARYTPGGKLDPTFGHEGRVTTDFPGLAADLSAVVQQPDGKILVAGGAFPLFVFAGNVEIARYNPDGTLDKHFGTGGIVTTRFPGQGSYASAIALQPDGKILIAGTDYVHFTSDESSDTDFALARYNPDGSLDTTFGSGGQVTTDFDGSNDDALALLVQPDGRIVAVGSAENATNFYDFAAARYLPDGTLDKTFGQGGKVRTDFGAHGMDRARAAVLQADGKIVAAGFAVSANGFTQNFAVARYKANGSLDPSFGTGGLQQVDFGSCCQSARSALLQADGKVVLAGFPDSESSDSDFTLARLNTDGTLDHGFGRQGEVRTSFGTLNGGATGAALQPDGKIVAVGFQATSGAKSAQFALARYLASGGGR